jgi:hypothetical protein
MAPMTFVKLATALMLAALITWIVMDAILNDVRLLICVLVLAFLHVREWVLEADSKFQTVSIFSFIPVKIELMSKSQNVFLVFIL